MSETCRLWKPLPKLELVMQQSGAQESPGSPLLVVLIPDKLGD